MKFSWPQAPAHVAFALATACAPPALADSFASSASSASVSTSVGSLSTSIQKSSESSSRNDDVAAGDYRIIDTAAAPDRPGIVRVQLQATTNAGPEGAFSLLLPAEIATHDGLTPGNVLAVRHRPYGLEFAKGEPRQPFFLVLDDGWHRELQTRAVAL